MIVSLFIWLAAIFIPGYLLSNLLVKTDKFLERIAYSLGLGSCILVAIFFARNFIPFRVESASLIFFSLGSFLVGVNIGHKESFSLPKPSRIELAFLLILAVQLSIILSTLLKFPLFSPFSLADPTYRIDYLQTGGNIVSYVTGAAPALLGQILYYSVHYHLAYLYALSPAPQNILLNDRVGMSILVLFSTFYLWLMSKRIFDSETKALAIIAVYSLSGFLWIGMVLNAQLFPNFYGLMIAAPFLVIAIKDVLNAESRFPKHFVLLSFALLNALMSHYSTLLFFPLLALVAATTRASLKKKIGALGMLLLPLAAALPLLYSTLVGFLSGGGDAPDASASWLASHISSLPSLSYVFLFITNDFTSFALLGFASVYVYLAIKKKDSWQAFPGLLFGFVIFASPPSSIAWRFAFIALLPLSLMAGAGLESILERVFRWLWMTKRHTVKIRFRKEKGLGLLSCLSIIILLTPIVYGSWGANTLAFASYDVQQNSKHDFAVYNAMLWMKNHSDAFFYTANDGKFTASRLLVGVPTDYQPSLLSNPLSAFSYGVHHQRNPVFEIVPTPYGLYNMTLKSFPVFFIATSANPPFPCVQYGIELTPLNATSGHAIKLRAEIFDSTGHLFDQNVTSYLYSNKTQVLKFSVINGNSTGILSFAKPGTYEVNYVAGTVPSNTLTLFMGSSRDPLNTPINLYQCYPYYWGNQRPFSQLPIVYDDKTDVKIYEVAP